MTIDEIAAEAEEAERETAAFAAIRAVEYENYLATLTKDARYYARNKAQRDYDSAMFRAKKANAVPPWLSDEQKSEILAIYHLSVLLTQATGVKHEVDHIVPLYGRNRKGDLHRSVCGLHVPWNLRAIPKRGNRERGDWFPTYAGSMEGDESIPF